LWLKATVWDELKVVSFTTSLKGLEKYVVILKQQRRTSLKRLSVGNFLDKEGFFRGQEKEKKEP